MTPSQPVSSSMRTASSAVRTSPLPITGMPTAALASPIMSQCASPANFSARVRAWIATALAPAPSSVRHTSTTLRESPSQPSRTFAVTGIEVAAAMRSTMAAMRGTSCSNAAPAQRFTTLRTGQPMLMSTRSGRRSSGSSHSTRVASAMVAGSEPNSWIPIGRSSGAKRQ